MPFALKFTTLAQSNLKSLEKNKILAKQLKAVRKALGYLETDPRHPSLKTHKFTSLQGPCGEEVFEAYAENKTPAAYRIFWFYGPECQEISIIAITPRP